MSSLQLIIEQTFKREKGIVIGALLRSYNDIELAEDALQDAMVEALQHWPQRGMPNKPGAWIMTTARRKAIDRLRRESTASRHLPALYNPTDDGDSEIDAIPDDRLKLMFTCCHPALAEAVQVALMLQVIAGLPTPVIAKSFLVSTSTMSQRLVRAKRKIRDANIPYQVPPAHKISERLDAILTAIYLIFNAGYTAPIGESLMRVDLCEEAIRLARLLNQLIEQEQSLESNAEALGLLALMLLHHARSQARLTPDGAMILLDDQDRTLWNQAQIQEGIAVLDAAIERQQRGPYQIQAAISALHAQAHRPDDTDWHQIRLLYQALLEFIPSSIVRLNHAVAVAKEQSPQAGLALLDQLSEVEELQHYHLYHAARADLLRQCGDHQQAAAAYRRALAQCENEIECAFLRERLRVLEASA